MKIKLAKKTPCEGDNLSQKQKEQYRSYVAQKLDETLIEQANEQGEIFTDSYLHPQCEYIKNIKKDGTVTN